MAQYKCTYHNLLEYIDRLVEANTKVDALKQLRQQLAPMCKPKVFAEKVKVERVKVAKVQQVHCAVCDSDLTRGEFVAHVRGMHG